MADIFTAAVSGGFTILGAAIASGVALFLRKQRSKADEAAEARRDAKRLKHLKAVLRADLETIKARARQVPGIVTVHKAANVEVSSETKDRCHIQPPSEFSNWEAMSLLPDEILEKVASLTRLISSHNYDIDRTGGAFGDNNWGPHVSKQAEAIARLAHEIIANMQHQNPPAYLE